MQVNLRIYCNSASKLKKEEITRYIWLGAVVVERDFRFVMFFSVKAEPLYIRYRAEPDNEQTHSYKERVSPTTFNSHRQYL